MIGRSILMVTPRFEPSTGGVETHVREVGARLAARGHRVTVIAGDPHHELSPEAEIEGIRVLRVRTWPPRSDAMLAPGLPALMASIGADIVHIQSYHTLIAPLGLATAKALRRPTVLTFHSGGHSSGLRERVRGLQLLALRPLLRRANALVAVAPFEASLLARRLRLRRTRFSIIPNGAELPLGLGAVERDPDLILSVGRLEAYKGHDQVIRALPYLRATHPSARLRIVGSGPDAERLRTIARQVGVQEHVQIEAIPGGDRTGMASALAGAGAVAILSRFESQGIAAYEAVGVGARVLVRDDSALGELVTRGWATGVAPGALPAEIAGRLADVLGAPQPPLPDVPTWDETAAQLARLYEQILRGGPA